MRKWLWTFYTFFFLVVAGMIGMSIYVYFFQSEQIEGVARSIRENAGGFQVIDIDSDGLPDRDEIRYGTDLKNKDTDGDKYSDNEEVSTGNNPLGKGTLIISEKDFSQANIRQALERASVASSFYATSESTRYSDQPDAQSVKETYELWITAPKRRIDRINKESGNRSITLSDRRGTRYFTLRSSDQVFASVFNPFPYVDPQELAANALKADIYRIRQIEDFDNKPSVVVEYDDPSDPKKVYRAWIWTTAGLVLKQQEIDKESKEFVQQIEFSNVVLRDVDDSAFSIPR